VMRKTRPLLESQLVMFTVMMVMVAVLAPTFGVNGTAAASVWANIAFSAVIARAFRRARPSRIRRRGIHRAPVARHRRPS
jgi:hypothetical protein